MSQCTQILNHLKRRPITAIQALELYGCFRLAARIYDLRSAGHNITSSEIETKNGKHIAQYRLVKSR
jgi:hypothetical protein